MIRYALHTGVGSLSITAHPIGYSFLCRAAQRKINNIVFIVKAFFVSFQTLLISSHC